jgi:Hint-domain/von Willebrand factor type A domain
MEQNRHAQHAVITRLMLIVTVIADWSGSMESNSFNDKFSPNNLPKEDAMNFAFKSLLKSMMQLSKKFGVDFLVRVTGFGNASDKTEIIPYSFLKHETIDNMISAFAAEKSYGGTDLVAPVEEALQTMMQELKKYGEREAPVAGAHVILLTDGGDTKKDVSTTAAILRQHRINLTYMTIGQEADVALLAGYAKQLETLGALCPPHLTHVHDTNTIVDVIVHFLVAAVAAALDNRPAMANKSPAAVTGVPGFSEVDTFLSTVQGNGFDDGYDRLMAEDEGGGAVTRLLSAVAGSKDCNQFTAAFASKSNFINWGMRWMRVWLRSHETGLAPTCLDQGAQHYISLTARSMLDDLYENVLPHLTVQVKQTPNWKPWIDPTSKLTPEQRKAEYERLLARADNDGGDTAIQASGARGGGGCFNVSARVVRLNAATGDEELVQAGSLQRGDQVRCNDGKVGTVEKVFVTRKYRQPLVKLPLLFAGQPPLFIMPSHPVKYYDQNSSSAWVHPKNVPGIEWDWFLGGMDVCSIMLDAESVRRGCVAVVVEGYNPIVLAHGITGDQVAEHNFFGNRELMTMYCTYMHLHRPELTTDSCVEMSEQSISAFTKYLQQPENKVIFGY